MCEHIAYSTWRNLIMFRTQSCTVMHRKYYEIFIKCYIDNNTPMLRVAIISLYGITTKCILPVEKKQVNSA